MRPTQCLYTTVLLIPFTILTACTSPKQKLTNQITATEKDLYNDSTMVPDNIKANKAILLYTEFATQFPDDTASAAYLFKAGDIASKINETQKAIDIFGQLIQNYPKNRNSPYALFLQGFIYENQVGDPLKAKTYYETFLNSYPDHPMAGDVSFSLENLGKSPEELIREFESKMNDSTITSADETAANAPN